MSFLFPSPLTLLGKNSIFFYSFSAYYSKFWTTQDNFWKHVDKHGMQIELGDFSTNQMDAFATFDPEKAKSVTILSRDTMEALKRLDPAQRVVAADYGKDKEVYKA